MAMENLSIAQHCDTLQYTRVHSRAYRFQLRRFSKGDYIYLHREAPTTLDVNVRCIIFRVKISSQVAFCFLRGNADKNVKSIVSPIWCPHVFFTLQKLPNLGFDVIAIYSKDIKRVKAFNLELN